MDKNKEEKEKERKRNEIAKEDKVSQAMTECEICRQIFIPKITGQRRCSSKCVFANITGISTLVATPKSSRPKRTRTCSESSPGKENSFALQNELEGATAQIKRLEHENESLKEEIVKLKLLLADKVYEKLELKPSYAYRHTSGDASDAKNMAI